MATGLDGRPVEVGKRKEHCGGLASVRPTAAPAAGAHQEPDTLAH